MGPDARSGTPNVFAKSVALPSLENAPQMIPPSESDKEPGKRYALPSSQLRRRGISKLSLDGTVIAQFVGKV
jgi:hypothetical protein